MDLNAIATENTAENIARGNYILAKATRVTEEGFVPFIRKPGNLDVNAIYGGPVLNAIKK